MKKSVFIKMWVSAWVGFFARYADAGFFVCICVRDQYETRYDPTDAATIRTYGHSYWVTADPFMEDPLPPWAIAAIVAETGPINRFPRMTFGHELFNFIRNTRDAQYTDIRIRAFANLVEIQTPQTTRRGEFVEFLKCLRQIRPDRRFKASDFEIGGSQD